MTAQVKEALKEAAGDAPPGKRSSTTLRKQVGDLVNGARTTLSLPKDLVESAVEALGGRRQAYQLVEELANTKPKSVPVRSAWVVEQRQQRLLRMKLESNLAGRVAH